MGEIAEAMLDGTLCAGCGTYMDDDPSGFPRYCCAECEPDYVLPPPRKAKPNDPRVSKPFQCSLCSRRFRTLAAAAQHERDKHQSAVGPSVEK